MRNVILPHTSDIYIVITTWGNVKRILLESSSVDVDKVHPTAIPRLREYALSSLYDFIMSIRNVYGHQSTYVNKRNNTIRELEIYKPALELENTAYFLIDVTNPVKPYVCRLNNTNIPNEIEDKVVKDLYDALLPQAQDSGKFAGIWWADENMYPLRPVFKGEDLRIEEKPDPSWILIDPNTHEEIDVRSR